MRRPAAPQGVLLDPRAEPDAPVALLAHGAGSTAEYVVRTFGPPMRALGLRAASWDATPPVGDRDHLDALAALVTVLRPEVVGGVSLGAHVAARWAAARCAAGDGSAGVSPVRALVFVLPAWTGEPGAVAAATGVTANDIATRGLGAVLADVEARAHPWAAAEVSRAWPAYDEATLVAALRSAAASSGPTTAELAAIGLPSVVVALDADPLHPAAVARTWATALGTARLEVVELPAIEAPDLPGAVLRGLGDVLRRTGVSGSR